jgi:hypothetical protein
VPPTPGSIAVLLRQGVARENPIDLCRERVRPARGSGLLSPFGDHGPIALAVAGGDGVEEALAGEVGAGRLDAGLGGEC